jgi:predicted DsbA family dithiol-disulfide isomerase
MVAAGLKRERAAAELDSSDSLAAVRAEEGEAHRLGVQGVPFFLVNGEVALSGAREPGAFLEAFEQVANTPQSAGEGGSCPVRPGSGPSC